jgi:hypothetical protein
MSKRKPLDVYFYIRLIPEEVKNYAFIHNLLLDYCKNKKLYQISGCFVEYCPDDVDLKERVQLQRMLYMLKDTKFLLCCYDKLTISPNNNIVTQFENDIKQYGSSIYFHFETISQKNPK